MVSVVTELAASLDPAGIGLTLPIGDVKERRLTVACLVAVANFPIWAKASEPHNFLCFSGYFSEIYYRQ